MTRYLLVPGRGIPLPGHWMGRLAEQPGYRWAPEPPGPPYVPAERVEALRAAVDTDETPAILVAHSAGCLTVALWAARHSGPVRGALLVTPPDIPPEWIDVPRTPLPFPSILVASRTDPYSTMEHFRRAPATGARTSSTPVTSGIWTAPPGSGRGRTASGWWRGSTATDAPPFTTSSELRKPPAYHT